jgi:ABC-type molybdate transport system permease subunit
MAILVGFVLYTWTAIHSGWSASGMNAFHTATLVVPPVVGGLAGWWTYRYWRWQ